MPCAHAIQSPNRIYVEILNISQHLTLLTSRQTFIANPSQTLYFLFIAKYFQHLNMFQPEIHFDPNLFWPEIHFDPPSFGPNQIKHFNAFLAFLLKVEGFLNSNEYGIWSELVSNSNSSKFLKISFKFQRFYWLALFIKSTYLWFCISFLYLGLQAESSTELHFEVTL